MMGVNYLQSRYNYFETTFPRKQLYLFLNYFSEQVVIATILTTM